MKKTVARLAQWIIEHYCFDEWVVLQEQVADSDVWVETEPKKSTPVKLKITEWKEGEPIDVPF